jgi:diaminobutyrate-2-oxoglutarate transaminase
VCLSKSIGGYGQPMALLLMRPDLDVWKPGQHTGTFRGNQLAFVAAAAALENWRDPAFGEGIATRGQVVKNWLFERIGSLAPEIEIRGLGLMWGIDVARAGGPDLAKEISAKCFQKGLIIERCGRDDTVLKLMPPLNIDMDHLSEGLEMLRAAAADAFGQRAASSVAEGRGLT